MTVRRFVLLALAGAVPVAAQSPSLSAESGMYAEAYDINNRAARRPAQSVRFYASPTFSWLGFEVGTNLVWSTEDQFTAQTLNRYYLNPRWSWGQLHGGDYTPFLNRWTTSAVRIRGGGVELTPGRFRVMATGGVSQDATDVSVFDAAPRRVMYAGLLGYGDPNSSFVEISALRAVDDSVGTDTLSVAPQENVVTSIGAGVALGRVRVKGEAAASLFSRDIRASELSSTSQPGGTDGVFTPRVSSRFDASYSGEARLALGAGSIGVQFEEVGPGFTTLGNPYLPNDKREVRLLGTYRLFKNRLAGSASVGTRSDNLAGDKRGTTTRRTGAFGATLITGQWLVSSASVLFNGITRNPLPLPPGTPDPGIIDSFRLRNISRSFSLVEQVRFTAAIPQTVTVSVSAQQVDDASPRFGDQLDASTMSAVLDWSATVRRTLTFSLQPGYERIDAAGENATYGSLGAGVSRRAPRSRWNASVLATHTQLPAGGSQWRANANSGIRLTARDNVSFGLRHSRVQSVAQPFAETLGSVRLTRRW
jgi:hypothetical protein